MNDITQAVETLRSGGTLLYPTDTVPGLGCDANNTEAVERVIEIKGRASDKGLIVLLDDDRKLNTYVKKVPDVAWDLLDHSTEPLTIIYPEGRNVAPAVLANDGTIAIRIVREGICHDLIRKFGKALVSTSANKSGDANPQHMDEVSQYVQDSVDHVVNLTTSATERSRSAEDPKPSKIIKLEVNGEFTFIRR